MPGHSAIESLREPSALQRILKQMTTSATQSVLNQENLLEQSLAEVPVRSFWATRHFTLVSIATQVALDFLAVVAALGIAYKSYRLLGLGHRVYYPHDLYLLTSATVAIGFVLLMERYGLYRPSSSLLHIRETEAILRGTFWSVAVFFMSGYLLIKFVPSRWLVALASTLLLVLVIAERVIYYEILRKLHLRGYGLDRVLIYGCSPAGVQIFRKLAQSPRAGMIPVGFVDDNSSLRGERIYESSYTRRKSLVVLGTGQDLGEILDSLRVTRVIVADPTAIQSDFQSVCDRCKNRGVQVSFAPIEHRIFQHQVNYMNFDGLMLAEIRPIQESKVYRISKRLLDLVVGTVMLLLVSPVMAIAALAIWKAGGGPVIFCQERVGQSGKIFRMFKFRTMYQESAAYAYTPRSLNDPRVTPVGRFLRRASLDELPQLINVLQGEMSLVGPRPEMPFIVAQYTPSQRERLMAKPGLTGLWQISADRAFEIHENIDYDLYYIQNRSILLDLVILLHTVIFAVRGLGAF